MLASYWVAFGRIVIGLTFILSLVGEIRNIASFAETIARFRILPRWVSKALAYLIISGEIVVIGSMLGGGSFLVYGFLLSGLMFVAFSVALTLVVFRKIDTACHCFGPSDKKRVGPVHIVRAGGLMVLAGGSCCILLDLKTSLMALDLLSWGLMGVVGAAFVMLWIQLGEIVELFRVKPI